MKHVVPWVLVATLWWGKATGESTASRLQFPIPSSLFKSDGYAHEEALFGIPKYGGSIAERLIHGGVSRNGRVPWNLCEAEEAQKFDKRGDPPFILMIDRGDCTFAKKVRTAQHLGASGVIIADNTCLCSEQNTGDCSKPDDIECEQMEPIMADDGSGADIAIPSFLMKKMDADQVKYILGQGTDVQVEMTWSLPAPDDRVEWSLWTSAMDTTAAPFKRDFKDVVKTLGKSAQFTPYYVVYDGNSYGCKGAARCGNLCTNGGRYCMTDPDFDTGAGVTGAAVVEESLRQKCIWNLYGGESAPLADQGIGEKWWVYVNEFFSNCPVANERFSDPSCIREAMKSAGVNPSSVDRCMSSSGGVIEDKENTILAGELTQKSDKSIVIVPTVFVNNVAERGGINTAAVLTTICAGFKSGTEPKVCRCAGLSSSDLVDACMHNRNPSGGAGGGGMSFGNTLFLLLVVAGIMGGVGYAHYKRTQAHMRDQVRGILAEYMPLEDLDAPGSSARVPFMASQPGAYTGGRKEQQLV